MNQILADFSCLFAATYLAFSIALGALVFLILRILWRGNRYSLKDDFKFSVWVMIVWPGLSLMLIRDFINPKKGTK